jgi:hypothetical protein
VLADVDRLARRVASRLTSGVTQIFATEYAFAALKSDGSVVTWGADGGDSSTVASQLASGVAQIFATASAFAALKTDGSVVTWGIGSAGGNSSAVATKLASGVIAMASPFHVAPGQPAAPVATAGDQQVTITVTSPPNGDPPTAHRITAASGESCTVAAAAGSCTITGLANGTAYTFTDVASNYGGVSFVSAASTPVTPAATPAATIAKAGGAYVPRSALRNGIPVRRNGTLQIPLGCRATGGCRIAGVLTTPLARARATTLDRFRGLRVGNGKRGVANLRIDAALLARLEARGVRRLRATLILTDHGTTTRTALVLLIPRAVVPAVTG